MVSFALAHITGTAHSHGIMESAGGVLIVLGVALGAWALRELWRVPG